MKKLKIILQRFKGIQETFLLIGIAWTLSLFISTLWSVNQFQNGFLNTLRLQAKTAQEKDIVFRKWGSLMGGVYVPVSENLKPNPFLSNIPERDITTPLGKLLTLVNPALMMRMVYDLEAKSHNIKSRLTSLKPINPINSPTAWERQALESFEKGSVEASKIDTIEGKEYYHFMQPIFIEESCLKCHASKGYKVGDIRGGISILIPTQRLKEISDENINRFITQRTIVWFLGMIGIFFAFVKLNRSERKRDKAEEELRLAYQNIENQIKERTEELSIKNLLLDSILNSAGEGIIGLDINGNSTFVNKAAAKMLGYEAHELLNINLHQNHHYKKEDGSVYLKESSPIYKTFTEGKAVEVKDEVFWRKDGTSFPVEYTSTPIIQSGKITGAVVVFTDISIRKKLENELKEELNFSNSLLDSLPGVLYLYDNNFNFLKWNKKFEEVTGYTSAEIAKMKPLDFFTDDHKKILVERIGSVFTLGYNEVEADFLTKSGKRIPYFFNGLKIKLKGEECLIGVGIDLTELNKAKEEILLLNKELEQKVTERTAKLTEANKELEAFSYTVSHDLRAPLRHINGFIELLNAKYSSTMDENAKRYLNIIHESATRMGMLIDNLLSFSRIGRSTASISHVNMNTLVKSVLSQYANEISNKNIKINVADLPEVDADPNLIMQVWSNLISNAIKYTGKTENPIIEIGSFKEDKFITYYVKDNGAGFDMEYYGKLFGVFQRLHGLEQFEGTGIGLANVKRIIDKHNGKVWAEGKVNEGATFYFSLPLKRNDH